MKRNMEENRAKRKNARHSRSHSRRGRNSNGNSRTKYNSKNRNSASSTQSCAPSSSFLAALEEQRKRHQQRDEEQKKVELSESAKQEKNVAAAGKQRVRTSRKRVVLDPYLGTSYCESIVTRLARRDLRNVLPYPTSHRISDRIQTLIQLMGKKNTRLDVNSLREPASIHLHSDSRSMIVADSEFGLTYRDVLDGGFRASIPGCIMKEAWWMPVDNHSGAHSCTERLVGIVCLKDGSFGSQVLVKQWRNNNFVDVSCRPMNFKLDNAWTMAWNPWKKGEFSIGTGSTYGVRVHGLYNSTCSATSGLLFKSDVLSQQFLYEGNVLANGTRNGQVWLWDLRAHRGAHLKLFSGADTHSRVFKPKSGQTGGVICDLRSLKGDPQRLLALDSAGRVFSLDCRMDGIDPVFTYQPSLSTKEYNLRRMGIDDSETVLGVSAGRGKLRIYSIRTGQLVYEKVVANSKTVGRGVQFVTNKSSVYPTALYGSPHHFDGHEQSVHSGFETQTATATAALAVWTTAQGGDGVVCIGTRA